MKRIAVTGSSGYLGQKLCSKIEDTGGEVVRLSRNVNDNEIHFELGQAIPSSALEGVDFLIHAAHDFKTKGDRCVEKNYEGSLPLLTTCRELQIPVTLVSTTSAFEGVDTGYGRAKLCLESHVIGNGGRVCRAGLIMSATGGGIFEKLLLQLRSLPVVPVVGPNARFYVSDEETLLDDLLLEPSNHQSGEVFLGASREPETMKSIVLSLLETLEIRKRSFGIDPSIVYYLSKIAETIKVPFPFRSESVRYLMRQISTEEIEGLSTSTLQYPNLHTLMLQLR